jgi:hypothetical protein
MDDIKDVTVDHTTSEPHHETGSIAKVELATLDAGYSESATCLQPKADAP